MRKKSIFIGCSKEELNLAETAKLCLERDFEVVIWNETLWDQSVFKINQGFLNDLLKATLRFDFGLIIGTADDKVQVRGREVMSPRDNIHFEFGLFLGRLGISNCAFIVEEEIKILSDIHGITLSRFKKDDFRSLREAVDKIGTMFKSQPDIGINFFPSSTLASVYYESFIAPTCRHSIQEGFDNDEGEKCKSCLIKVIIPSELHDDINLQFERIKRGYNTKTQSFNFNGRPRSISVEVEIIDNVRVVVDFPTVLSGINHAIRNLLPNDFNIMSHDYQAIMERELDRFIHSLRLLCARNGLIDMVSIERV